MIGGYYKLKEHQREIKKLKKLYKNRSTVSESLFCFSALIMQIIEPFLRENNKSFFTLFFVNYDLM